MYRRLKQGCRVDERVLSTELVLDLHETIESTLKSRARYLCLADSKNGLFRHGEQTKGHLTCFPVVRGA